MNPILSLALLIVGVALVVFGLMAADSLASSFSRFFTGEPTDRAIWLLISGAVLIAISGFGLFRRGRSSP